MSDDLFFVYIFKRVLSVKWFDLTRYYRYEPSSKMTSSSIVTRKKIRVTMLEVDHCSATGSLQNGAQAGFKTR